MPRSKESLQVASRRGGQATKEKHGRKLYQAAGRLGGQELRETRGPEHFVAMGAKGRASQEAKVWNEAIEAAEALARGICPVQGACTCDYHFTADRIRALKRTT